jgi:formylglycine-generating enzyme required for sulfatase activity/serine/threonine protein kinase
MSLKNRPLKLIHLSDMIDGTFHFALPDGSRLAHYEIKKMLGAGGFGVTYLAWDTLLHGDVAIKEYLPTEWALRTNALTVVPRTADHREKFDHGRKRFLEEARTLNKFNEVNIVRVKNFMEANGTAYMVMDYEEGETLKDLLSRKGILEEDALLAIFIPLLSGLRAVHRADFLHRDIKPGNIYLRRDGTPVLIDFGAARQALGEHSRSLTAVLSPGYAPFEQYSIRSNQGPWTDLYAVGATLYRCIRGEAPPESSERMIMLRDGEADPLIPAREICRGKYSDRLVSTIDWMLQLDGKDRPRRVEEVLHRLLDDSTRLAVNAGKSPISPIPPDLNASTGVASVQTPEHKSKTVTKSEAKAGQPTGEPEKISSKRWVIVLALVAICGLIGLVIARLMNSTETAVEEGQLRIKVNIAGAQVLLDGTRVGKAGPGQALDIPNLAPGRHTIEVVASSHKSYRTSLDIQAGRTKTIEVEMKPERVTNEPEMVRINAGCFRMGSPDTESDRYSDEQQHSVCVEDFRLGKYEVTFDEYDDFAQVTGRSLPDDKGWGRGRRPVIGVTWQDAIAYSDWLSQQTGHTYGLPTEAEWEYAARAGTTTPFFTGACIHTEQANYNGRFDYNNCGAVTGTYRSQTAPVGSLQPNNWGLYDITGNVWEWTCSSYDNKYGGTEQRCARKNDAGPRVIRGGSWDNVPNNLRTAYRNWNDATSSGSNIGFRISMKT